jgi:hypothetical protein
MKSDDENTTYPEQDDWVVVYEGQDEELEVISF